jgi:predicted transcriptional regulator
MKIKVTLTVDQEVVRQAKEFANKRSKSLSSVIEAFLKHLVERSNSQSVVDHTRGLAKDKFKSLSDREIREKHYKEKHDL